MSHIVYLDNTSNSQNFHSGSFLRKNSTVCAEFIIGSKFHFTQWKTYFSQFIDKFLKTEVMNCLIHYVLNVIRIILYKLTNLFSTVKLKLGPNFSQFNYRFKIEIFSVGLRLYFQFFSNSE